MFLTNQLFPHPWEEPQQQTPIVKDRHYYSINENLWNNPVRVTPKLKQYYHQKQKQYNDTHDSDAEILRLQEEDRKHFLQEKHQTLKQDAQERLGNRKIERKLLQVNSKQKTESKDDKEFFTDIMATDPYFADEMRRKRSKTYKDPSRPSIQEPCTWDAINHLPTKQLSKIIRPSIIKGDRDACEFIRDKIEEEKQIERIQKGWFSKNRNALREKFQQQRIKNLDLEKKTGKKLDEMLEYELINRRSVTPEVVVTNTFIQNFDEQNKTPSMRPYTTPSAAQLEFNVKGEALSPVHQEGIEFEDAQIEDNIQQDSGQSAAMKRLKIKSLTAVGSPPTKNKYSSFYDRLSKPKEAHTPQNLFDYPDYKGLLHRDYKDALQNSNFKKSSSIFQSQFTTTGPCTTTREIFPMPYTLRASPTPNTLRATPTPNANSSTARFNSNTGNITPQPYNRESNIHSRLSRTVEPSERIQSKENLNKKKKEDEQEVREVQDSMKEMNNFDRLNGSVRRKIGYPRVAYEEALFFQERFAEHLKSKKK